MKTKAPLIRIVDDDSIFRESKSEFFKTLGWEVEEWCNAKDFLKGANFERPGCIILDIRMPEMSGVELQKILFERKIILPIVFLTGHGDITTAVHTMKYGANDFLEKSGDPIVLLQAVTKAVEVSINQSVAHKKLEKHKKEFESLTRREQEVFLLTAKGMTNKEVGEILGIGTETVKMHRANAYSKLNVQSALEAYQWLECLPKDFKDTLSHD